MTGRSTNMNSALHNLLVVFTLYRCPPWPSPCRLHSYLPRASRGHYQRNVSFEICCAALTYCARQHRGPTVSSIRGLSIRAWMTTQRRHAAFGYKPPCAGFPACACDRPYSSSSRRQVRWTSPMKSVSYVLCDRSQMSTQGSSSG